MTLKSNYNIHTQRGQSIGDIGEIGGFINKMCRCLPGSALCNPQLLCARRRHTHTHTYTHIHTHKHTTYTCTLHTSSCIHACTLKCDLLLQFSTFHLRYTSKQEHDTELLQNCAHSCAVTCILSKINDVVLCARVQVHVTTQLVQLLSSVCG